VSRTSLTGKARDFEPFIRGIPKAELHIHIEGSLEPEMVFKLAQKHNIRLAYPSVDALRQAYSFHDLQSFLNIYYAATEVLRDEGDFYALTLAYLQKAHEQGVVHCEIFFDPQTHTERGIAYDTVLSGIVRALDEGNTTLGVSSRLILCFLRHLSADAAMQTLEAALPHKDRIAAVGLDSSELGHPPSKLRLCSSVLANRDYAPLRTPARKVRRPIYTRRSIC
jgi:adenosine deaminase